MTIKILREPEVELIGHYGDDLTIAQRAWTSTTRDLSIDKLARVEEFVTRLYRDGHHTPFEGTLLHFVVRADRATHDQILKHRIGVSINSESARYKELDSHLYVPTEFTNAEEDILRRGVNLYHECLARLVHRGVPRKRAKEIARFLLPMGHAIQFDVVFNLRSFAHFLGLRMSPHAQEEIQVVAQKMLAQVEATEQFPAALAAIREGLGA